MSSKEGAHRNSGYWHAHAVIPDYLVMWVQRGDNIEVSIAIEVADRHGVPQRRSDTYRLSDLKPRLYPNEPLDSIENGLCLP